MSRVGSFLGKLFAGQPGGGNDTPLRAYGKLPMYAEYRRLEVSPGAPTVFSQWMDAGRLAWMQGSAHRGEAGAMIPSRLVVQPPGLKEVVVACTWDSRDTVGRIFPFSFFVVCAPEALGKNPPERHTAAAWIHEQLERAYVELRVLGGGGDFYRLYRGRTVSLRPDNIDARVAALLEQAGRIDATAWFSASGLSPPASQAEWFASLARRSARWRGQPADFAQVALACPLAAGIPFDAQTMLWLRWIEPLAKQAARAPWSIAPAARDGAGHCAYFILRDLMPDDFQLLTSQASEYGFVDNLSRPANAASVAAAAPAAAPPPSNPPTGPLLDWLVSTTTSPGN